MVIEFSENKLSNGDLEVNWIASTGREWQRMLTLLKKTIPQNARVYDVEGKRWILAPDYVHRYFDIKQAFLDDDPEMFEEVDEAINEESLAAVLDHDISKLPKSMRARALFAIRAVVGLIDAPVQYCLTRDAFGAYKEDEEIWCFEDGRYSWSSPEEHDRKAIARAQKRIAKAVEQSGDYASSMDEEHEHFWKQKLRNALLEKYDHQCYICSIQPINLSKLHMHRVIPGKEGGMYVESNIVILCAGCHSRHEGLSWDDIIEAARAVQS